MIDLTGKRFCIFGLQGSGKTYLAKSFLEKKPHSLVYDTLGEYEAKNYYRWAVKYRTYCPEAIDELSRCITEVVEPNAKAKKLDMLLIDEANRFFPFHKPLFPAALDMNDFCRHWNELSLGFICRRPQQLNPDITNLAHCFFIFRLPGKADIEYLNQIVKGLGDEALTLEPYHFLFVDEMRRVTVCKPVER